MEYRTNHFSISLPAGDGQDSVPALLRHLAAALEERGQLEVRDIVFHSDVDQNGVDWPFLTVYYDHPNGEE